jgi:hypothetical protein
VQTVVAETKKGTNQKLKKYNFYQEYNYCNFGFLFLFSTAFSYTFLVQFSSIFFPREQLKMRFIQKRSFAGSRGWFNLIGQLNELRFKIFESFDFGFFCQNHQNSRNTKHKRSKK